MKKSWLSGLLALCLLIGMANAEAERLTGEDFVFVYDGAVYTLSTDAAALIAAAEKRDGESMRVMEADSCLFSGKDKEFTGRELMLATYPILPGGGDQLETIAVLNGPWKTARGVGIGSSRAQVENAYGPGAEDYDCLFYAVDAPYASPTLIFQFDLETDTVVAFMLLACSA